MKISIFTQYSLYGQFLVAELVRLLGTECIDRVYLSEALLEDGHYHGVCQVADRMLPEYRILKNTERKLIFDLIRACEPNINATSPYPFFDSLYENYGIPIALTRRKPDAPEVVAQMAADASDVFLSLRYSGLFREPSMAIPHLGLINLHSSLLPRFRGLENVLQALIHQDTSYGPTLHWILNPFPNLDNGPVICQQPIPTEPGKSLVWHMFQLYRASVPLILKAVQDLESGMLTKDIAPQPQEAFKTTSIPTADEFARLSALGYPLVTYQDVAHIMEQAFHLSLTPAIWESCLERYPVLKTNLISGISPLLV
ncbi:MAG TPA: hypothetical protein DCE41_22725 [Cytophagales bacterium]|nr:hypothetical protein [Cytophagales bacterium]